MPPTLSRLATVAAIGFGLLSSTSVIGQTPPASTASQGVLAAVPALPQAPAPKLPAPNVTFKAGTELVALNVTVTDDKNRYIQGLSKDDFAVFEDGVKQDVTFFATNNVPLDIAILLDTSASMTEKLPTAQVAATGFARTLRPGDRAEVMGFSNDIKVLQPFTNDLNLLERAIRDTAAHGGTSLYNAVYIALQEFAKLNRATSAVRRQAIVVLTDGEDTASLLSFDDLLDRVKRAGIAIYPISILAKYEAKKIADGAMPRYFSQADYALKTLAQETGARVYFPLDISELSGVYAQISSELSAQYSLGYPPKNTRPDGTFRRIVVRLLNLPGVRTRTRSGYFAERPIRAALMPERR